MTLNEHRVWNKRRMFAVWGVNIGCLLSGWVLLGSGTANAMDTNVGTTFMWWIEDHFVTPFTTCRD